MFTKLKGVVKVTSGYSGGKEPNPTYQQIGTGKTDYAEVVQIKYDESIISFKELAKIFFAVHDPTTLNRQGNDIGTQYRSAIFYHTNEQKEITEQVIAQIEKDRIWRDPIVTQVSEFISFYPAEEYHHNYFEKNPNQGYCRVVIKPKMDHFKENFQEKLIEDN
jgi:peptide-methionine (S)-S-oxide reductase